MAAAAAATTRPSCEAEAATTTLSEEEKERLSQFYTTWKVLQYTEKQPARAKEGDSKHPETRTSQVVPQTHTNDLSHAGPRSFDERIYLRSPEYLGSTVTKLKQADRPISEKARSTSFDCWMGDGKYPCEMDTENEPLQEREDEQSNDFIEFLAKVRAAKCLLETTYSHILPYETLDPIALVIIATCLFTGWSPGEACSCVIHAFQQGEPLIRGEELSWMSLLGAIDDICVIMLPELSLHLKRHSLCPSMLFQKYFGTLLLEVTSPVVARHIAAKMMLNQSLQTFVWIWTGILSWKQKELSACSTLEQLDSVLKRSELVENGFKDEQDEAENAVAKSVQAYSSPKRHSKVSPEHGQAKYNDYSLVRLTEARFMETFLTLPRVCLPVRPPHGKEDRAYLLHSADVIHQSRIKWKLNQMGTAYSTKYNEGMKYVETALRSHYFVNRCLGSRSFKANANVEKYDWIGFDMDHTLIDYDTDATSAVIWEAALCHLVRNKAGNIDKTSPTYIESGKPTSVKDVVNYLMLEFQGLFDLDSISAAVEWGSSATNKGVGESRKSFFRMTDETYPPCWLEFARPGYIVDTHTGNVLVVDHCFHLKELYHGGKSIDAQRKPREYLYHDHDGGKECFRCFLQNLTSGDNNSDGKCSTRRYEAILTYFDAPMLPLYALLVSTCDELASLHNGLLQEGIYEELWKACQESTLFSYSRFCADGWSHVLQNPSSFVSTEKAKPIKKWIRHLKNPSGSSLKHVKCFLLTNADWKQTQIMMSFAFGDDWASMFDLIVVSARKYFFRRPLNKWEKHETDNNVDTNESYRDKGGTTKSKLSERVSRMQKRPARFSTVDSKNGKTLNADDLENSEVAEERELVEKLRQKWGTYPLKLKLSGSTITSLRASAPTVLSGGSINQFLATLDMSRDCEDSERTVTNLSVLYIGDHIHTDIIPPDIANVDWKTIAVTPDMKFSDLSCTEADAVRDDDLLIPKEVPVKQTYSALRSSHSSFAVPSSMNTQFHAANWKKRKPSDRRAFAHTEFWLDRVASDCAILRIPSVGWLAEALRSRKSCSSSALQVAKALLFSNSTYTTVTGFHSVVGADDILATALRLENFVHQTEGQNKNFISRMVKLFSSNTNKKIVNPFFRLARMASKATRNSLQHFALVPGRPETVLYNNPSTLKKVKQNHEEGMKGADPKKQKWR